MAAFPTDQDDVITGTGDNDVIDALAGNDTVYGEGGSDRLLGNAGDDMLSGGDGADVLVGGAGADTLFGGATAAGGGADDSLEDWVDYSIEGGSNGGVTVNLYTSLFIFPSAPNASRSIGPGEAFDSFGNYDRVSGIEHVRTGNFTDHVNGSDVRNIIETNGGNDRLFGFGGDDELDSGSGDDSLDGGAGNDRMRGGAGNDTYTVDAEGDVVIELPGEGTDTISTVLASYSLAALPDVENLSGTSNAAQTLTGNDGNNSFSGTGADTMIGGLGNDSYFVDDSGDVVTELADQGLDTIFTSFSTYSIADQPNIERLQGIRNGPQTLIGNAGANTISGGRGADTLIGGGGNDRYGVNNEQDNVVEEFDGGVDEVGTSVDYTLGANVENLTAIGSGSIVVGLALIGNEVANIITGGDGDDFLDGRAGADTLRGGKGDDGYSVDEFDTIVEAPDSGIDGVDTSAASYTLPDNVENLAGFNEAGQELIGNDLDNGIDAYEGLGTGGNSRLLGLGGNDRLEADEGNDFLDGGSGNDRLFGNEGNDRLEGGTGNDLLNGGSGDDELTGGEGNDLLDISDGGEDTAFGNGGNDGIYAGAALSAGDVLDGGAGEADQLGLQGDYGSFGDGAAPFTFSAAHLTGIEQLVLLPGSDPRFGDTAGADYSYNLKTVDANVAAGERLVVTFNTLSEDENVTFDGAAETDGFFLTYGGQGVDRITGGQGDDGFFFGIDKRFGELDAVDGQGGVDQLGLQGVYTGENRIVLGDDQLTSVEFIVLLTGGDARFGAGGAGYSYDLTTSDGNVAAGATLIVSANTLRSDEVLIFDGSAESDGRFRIFSGNGADLITGGDGDDEITGLGSDDTIVGGDGADRINGGLGADALTGGDGADTLIYAGAADSTGLDFDTLIGFDYRVDKIDLPGAVTGFTGLIETGALNGATFDADLAAAVNEKLIANSAVIFRPDTGDYAMRDFAVIDANGDGVYTVGADFVFEIVDPAVPIEPVSDFFI